jgi:formamidopyrimidine-DNA glycosylase
MPELPEVETIAMRLKGTNGLPSILEKRITGVSTDWPRHFALPAFDQFRDRTRNQRIHDVRRRGKFIVFDLDQETMLIHLRMSGELRLEKASKARGKYDHTVFELQDGWELRFSDSRKFGKIYLAREDQDVLGKLGPEPLSDDFSPQMLREMLKAKRRLLKPLLLDQTFIAGIGNIYADEALHRAHLHPRRRTETLSGDEIEALWDSMRATLLMGIKNNGASIDWVYRGGEFQNQFAVYQREGEQCPSCKSKVERIVVGQRGTYFCPTCQPEAD